MENIVLSGQPSIIIKCGCDFEVNNIKFKEDQVIACITDCNVDFAYTAANRSARQGAGLLNYSESVELSEITISSVPFNKMLSTIIFGSNNSVVNKPCLIQAKSDSDGKIALSGRNISNVQVMSLDYEPIDFTIDNDIVTVEPNKIYRIYYKTMMLEGMSNKTMPTSLPYFKIESVSKGNSIGETREPVTQIIKIRRAALQLDPFFRFNNGIDKFDLIFKIIKDKEDIIEYGK